MVYIDGTKRAGWDDLYEDYFEEINQLIEDNLNLKHNKELIENLFPKMLKVLDKAVLRMKEIEEDKSPKEPWFVKVNNLKEYAKKADTLNKKVITINLIDQFLRMSF